MTSTLTRASELYQAGNLAQAEVLYREVLQQTPEHIKALNMLGVVLFRKGDNQGAIESITQVLALDETKADAHHNLATVYRILGDFAKAEHHYRRSLVLKPNYAESYFNFMEVKKFTDDDAVVSALEHQLNTLDQFSGEDQCFLHFAAGKLYKDLGRYDTAFRHYQQGNQKSHSVYDGAKHEALVSQLIEVCDRDFFATRTGWGDSSTSPIFIVGMPRSGTTLTEQILTTDQQVVALGELPDIPTIESSLSSFSTDKTAYPACLPELSQDIFSSFAKAYQKRVKTLGPVNDKSLTLDKLPGNYLRLALIVLLFPNAKIIHCRRHPLDTCLSCYFHRFRSGHEYSYSFETLGHRYRNYQTLIQHWQKVLPVPIFDLDYEALVENPEAMSQKLFDFCGLEWRPECLAFHQTDRPLKTASNWQVRQPLYRSAVNRWHRYEGHLAPLKASLGL